VIEAAKKYLEAGLCVLPAVRAEKRPSLLCWKSFQTRLPTVQQVEQWFGANPDAMCIVAGSISGNLELIDFDAGAKQFDEWASLVAPELLARLVIARTQSGGRHVIYRVNEPVCGNIKLSQAMFEGKVETLIETRGEGGLFLCAPTVGYRWGQGSLDVLPTISGLEREQLLEAAWSLNEYQMAPAGKASKVSDNEILRPGDDFNERGDIRELLSRHGWVLAKPGANEYWRRPGKTMGWSATLKDRVLYVFSANAWPFESNRAYAPFAVYSLLEFSGDYEAAARGLRSEGFGDDGESLTPYSCPPVISLDDDIPALEPMASQEDPGTIPDHLLRIPGFIAEVADHCLQTAPYPNQVMAFSGALALQAFLAGRKVRDPGDNRTNIYLLGLAHSASGKDWPRKLNTRILHEIGVADCIGERFASGEGIQDSLFLSPSMLFQTDEIDGMLLSISKSRDARHEAIMGTLLTFYSSANSFYPMRRKAGKESPGAIDQPSLVIFGTAIPNHYYESLSERMLTNGFFARMIILECGKRGSGQEPVISPIPDRIIETARWWHSYQPGQGNLQNWHPIPAIVPQTDEGKKILAAARIEAEQEYERFESNGDSVGTTVWGRVSEQSRKLALLYAISENHRQPEIGRDAARWAVEFTMHQTRRMLCMAGRHVSRNDFDAMAKEMIRVLQMWRDKRGSKPMPEWELSRRLPWKPSDQADVVTLLRKQRLVDCGPSPSKTKPGTIYWLVDS
jgi:hypothetical protein